MLGSTWKLIAFSPKSTTFTKLFHLYWRRIERSSPVEQQTCQVLLWAWTPPWRWSTAGYRETPAGADLTRKWIIWGGRESTGLADRHPVSKRSRHDLTSSRWSLGRNGTVEEWRDSRPVSRRAAVGREHRNMTPAMQNLGKSHLTRDHLGECLCVYMCVWLAKFWERKPLCWDALKVQFFLN